MRNDDSSKRSNARSKGSDGPSYERRDVTRVRCRVEHLGRCKDTLQEKQCVPLLRAL